MAYRVMSDKAGSYLKLAYQWKAGDTVEISFPPALWTVRAPHPTPPHVPHRTAPHSSMICHWMAAAVAVAS